MPGASLQNRSLRIRAVIVCVLACGVIMVRTAEPAHAQQDQSATENAFVAQINDLRAARGLNTLRVDGELRSSCRRWADKMRADGDISHTKKLDEGVTADWEKIGENVGMGGDVKSLMDAFVASPKHYENLIDPAYQYVGVGVVFTDSLIFTCHRFMRVFDQPAPAPQPRKTAPTTTVPQAIPFTDAEAVEDTTTVPPTTTTAPPTTAPPITAPATTVPLAVVYQTIEDLKALETLN